MHFLDRIDELRRLDAALHHPGSFTAIWGRRRVGKSRLLLEWSSRHDGLYTVADLSAAPVQRRYLAAAVAGAFPRVRVRRIPGLALVSGPPAGGGRRFWLDGALHPGRTALPARGGPLARQRPPELARPPRTAPVAGGQWVQLADDAGGPPRCGRTPLRSCGRGVRSAAPPPGIPWATPSPAPARASRVRSTRSGAARRGTGNSRKTSVPTSTPRWIAWCSILRGRYTTNRTVCSARKPPRRRPYGRYWM